MKSSGLFLLLGSISFWISGFAGGYWVCLRQFTTQPIDLLADTKITDMKNAAMPEKTQTSDDEFLYEVTTTLPPISATRLISALSDVSYGFSDDYDNDIIFILNCDLTIKERRILAKEIMKGVRQNCTEIKRRLEQLHEDMP